MVCSHWSTSARMSGAVRGSMSRVVTVYPRLRKACATELVPVNRSNMWGAAWLSRPLTKV